MTFKTYGANDVPDLVSEGSVLAGKLDAGVTGSSIQLAPHTDSASFDVGFYEPGEDSHAVMRKIINVSNPEEKTDAANKGYVDALIPNIRTLDNIFSADRGTIQNFELSLNEGSLAPQEIYMLNATNLKILLYDNQPIHILPYDINSIPSIHIDFGSLTPSVTKGAIMDGTVTFDVNTGLNTTYMPISFYSGGRDKYNGTGRISFYNSMIISFSLVFGESFSLTTLDIPII